jgi:group I intron endonuclease
MKGVVYLATNMINGDCYVGRTVNSLEYRKRKHEQPSSLKSENTYHFHAAIQKYGKENFLWEVLEEVEDDNKIRLNTILNKYEIYYIGVFDSKNSGYNLTDGGGGTVGMKASESTKKKMSATRQGKKINRPKGIKMPESMKLKQHELKLGDKNPMYGKVSWNKGKKNWMIPWNRGIPMIEEVRKKVSEGRKGKTAGENHPMWNKHHKPESNEKNRFSHIGKPMHPNTKAGLIKANTGRVPWNKGLTKETNERVRKAYENLP